MVEYKCRNVWKDWILGLWSGFLNRNKRLSKVVCFIASVLWLFDHIQPSISFEHLGISAPVSQHSSWPINYAVHLLRPFCSCKFGRSSASKTWKENGNYDSHLLHSAHAWSNGALGITSDRWFRTEESLHQTLCLNLASCHVQLIQFGRIKIQIISKCTFLRQEPHLVAHVILYTRII